MDGDELLEDDGLLAADGFIAGGVPLEGEPDLFLGEDIDGEDGPMIPPLSEDEELDAFGFRLVDGDLGDPAL